MMTTFEHTESDHSFKLNSVTNIVFFKLFDMRLAFLVNTHIVYSVDRCIAYADCC